MDRADALVRIELKGPPLTGPLGSGDRARKQEYKNRIRYAARNCRVRRPVSAEGPLAVRIVAEVNRGRKGDCDNIAKPILDSLHDLLGEDSCGRSKDERVKRLEVSIFEVAGPERVLIEVHALRTPGCVHIG